MKSTTAFDWILIPPRFGTIYTCALQTRRLRKQTIRCHCYDPTQKRLGEPPYKLMTWIQTHPTNVSGSLRVMGSYSRGWLCKHTGDCTALFKMILLCATFAEEHQQS
ncbi:hypothetical protein O6H91_15G083700 [Diphasiastrum complanatum]|uniref:Uncharacterized protein n=1 Tax=Diphasiastrum complanatum TaxID=34168 RepID=A0ACC2BKY6_DIPCM|nr:hypothetical protein O6H91_15G083700 [Diphasiastrum complanatum]